MIKILQSEWAGSVVGAIIYFLVLAFSWHPPPIVEESASVPVVKKNQLILDPLNPEIEQVMEELKSKKLTLDKREAQLLELAARLQNEREEIDAVTQSVYRIQQQFDSSILKVRDAEVANLKKLAKTYLSMSPEGAAMTFKTMDDDSVAKILRNMKEIDAAQFLDALSKQGPDAPRRTARIVERMRVAISESATPPPRGGGVALSLIATLIRSTMRAVRLGASGPCLDSASRNWAASISFMLRRILATESSSMVLKVMAAPSGDIDRYVLASFFKLATSASRTLRMLLSNCC